MGTENGDLVKQGAKSKSLRYTVQRDEAREAVGITVKQLRTWQEAGLFSPELGKGSQRFTESDVKRLTFLRRLIIELGLPVSTVKELYASFYHGPVTWQETLEYQEQGLSMLPAAPENSFSFLDLREKKLIGYGKAFLVMRDDLVRKAKNPSIKEYTEERLMILKAIRASQIPSSTPAIYSAELESPLDRLRQVALAARIQAEIPWESEETAWFIHPTMPGDPDLDQAALEGLWRAHHSRMGTDPTVPPF